MIPSTFWNYTIWYILLAISTLAEIVFVLVKTKERHLAWGFFLSILGLTLWFETIILIFMRAYTYYPMILKDPPFAFDAVLAGNLFSQFSVSATALIVTVFDLNTKWMIFLALLYGLIEELFLALGIYSHNWYQTWMTIVFLFLFFWISKQMYSAIRQGVKPIVYYGYIALGLFPLYVISIMWGYMVAGHLGFSKTIFSDPISSHYFLCLAVFAIPAAVVMMFVYYSRLSWNLSTLAVLSLYLFYYVCYQFGLILISDGWFLVVTSTSMLWMYFSVLIMDRSYGGPGKKNA